MYMIGKFLAFVNNSSMLSWLDDLGNWFESAVDAVFIAYLGPVLWGLCDIFFVILNLFESLFNQIAGISSGVKAISGTHVEGDIVLYLIQSSVVQQVFMSVLILSLFLLIIFTIFAIVKNQYSDKQEPVSKIINSSVKALLMYLLVPVATIVCLIVGNVVLQAINDATKAHGGSSASEMLFTTAAHGANRLRGANLSDNRSRLKIMINDGQLDVLKPQLASIGIKSGSDAELASAEEIEYIATLVDEYYVRGELGALGMSNIYELFAITQYYSLWEISLITIWIGGGFLIWAIGKITWGLVARMFKVTLFYAISPAVMATFPIDNGGALGKWRSEMVKNITMAYVAVGVMNVLYSVLPFINSINFVDAGILKLFLVIVAFSSAKDLIGSISGWFGTGDALSEGIKAKSQWDAAQKKAGGIATKAIGRYGGIRGGIEDAAKRGESKWKGALQGFYGTTDAYKKQQEAAKAFLDGKEGYKGARKNLHTQFGMNEDAVTMYEAKEAIEKEKKAIGLKIAQMEEVRDKQLAAAAAAGATSDELDKITDRWKKAIDKQKESASFIAPLIESEQLDIDSRQKDLEKRQGNFASFDSFEKGIEQDTKYFENIRQAIFKETHRYINRDEWAAMKKGDFGIFAEGEERTKARGVFDVYASDIASNQHEIERAHQQIANLASSGGKGAKYVEETLGDKLDSFLDKVVDSKTGEATYSKKDDYDSKAISDKIQAEQGKLTKIASQIAQDIKSLDTRKGDIYKQDKYTEKELLQIGKSQGKK